MKMIRTTIRFTKSSLICLSVAVFGMLLTACRGQNTNEPDPKEEQGPQSSTYETVVEIGANILQSDNTAKGPHRVHLGEDHTGTSNSGGITSILWTAGDEVACWNAEEQKWAPYVLTGGANTTSARFQGKAVHIDDNVQGQAALNINHAIFPLSATVKNGTQLISPGNMVHSIYFTMPGTQLYQDSLENEDGEKNPTFGTQYNVMTGTRNDADKNHIFFTSTGGVLMLRIKGSSFLSTLYGLKLVSNDSSEKLWGTFTAAIGPNGRSTVEVANDINGTPLANMVPPLQAGDNTLILDCSTGSPKTAMTLSQTEFTNFYFVLPYGVFTTGFTVYIDSDGIRTSSDETFPGNFDNGKIVTNKDNHIIQSDIKVMPALELTENVTLTWDLDDLYNQGTIEEF